MLILAGRESNRRGNEVPVEPKLDRKASKQAVGRLVIQFRIERAAKRVGWFAAISFVVMLVLLLPWVNRPIIKLMS
jgi:hypothetical protein